MVVSDIRIKSFVIKSEPCAYQRTLAELGYPGYYTLPCSKLAFHVSAGTFAPTYRTFSSWHGDGKGIYPLF